MENTEDTNRRFNENIKRVDECHIWIGAKDHRGYGRFNCEGNNIPAHHHSYRRVYGDIPEGHELHHECRKRACVNPDHLRAVTHAENMKLAAAAGAWSGGRNSQAKLTGEMVFLIRHLSHDFAGPGTHYTAKELSAMFGIKLRTVYAVLKYESWDFPEMVRHNWKRDRPTYCEAPWLFRPEIEDIRNPFYEG